MYVKGEFTMLGGTISRNSGVGVTVGGGRFTMNNGTINGNTDGGVYVQEGRTSTFTMNGGTISGNTRYSGGGVYVKGTFTMTGGEISGNTASSQGGGVYIEGNGTFTKSGTAGVIYGGDASANQWNKADGAGHAVYAGGGKIRDTTARATMALDSKQTGKAGGWE